MKSAIATSSLLLGIIFLAGCSQQPVSQTPTDETANWQKYESAGSFSFEYPQQDCDYNGKCHDIELDINGSVITFLEDSHPYFSIYYGADITDEESVNSFLQTTLLNPICKIDSMKDVEGTSMKYVFLDKGCSLYGPDYEEFVQENPTAIGLAGKTRAYWDTNSGELVVYVLAEGGGCAFKDCSIEGKISDSMNLGGKRIQNM